MQFLSPIDLAQNELQNPRLHQLTSAPGSPVTGQLYYNTTDNVVYWWNGSAWIDAAGDTITYGAVTEQTAFGASSGNGAASTVARSDHTHGTPTHDGGAHSAISLSSLAVPTSDLSLNSKKIVSLLDPTSAQDAATKAYVDAQSSGLTVKAAVRAATTANITLSGAQTIDGVSVIAGDRVLVKDQSSGATNGIYVVAAGAWTRATDADTSAEVMSGMFCFVSEGTANSDSGWVLTTNNTITLGTTALVFAQFSGAGQITPGTGMTKTGNTLNVIGTSGRIVANADSIDIDNTWAGQTSLTTLGTVTTGTWSATAIAANKGGTGQTSFAIGDLLYASGAAALSKLADVATGNALISGGVGVAPSWGKIALATHVSGTLPVANGGTGGTTAATAKTSLGFMTRYAVTFGGSTSQTITHNLNTLDVVVEVYVVATGAKVVCDVTHATVNTVTLGFANAPAASSLRAVVIG